MMGRIPSKIASAILRVAEIVAGGVVLGVMANNVRRASKNENTDRITNFDTSFFYSISLAAGSILVALMLVVPTMYTFAYFVVDFFIGVAWFASFAFLIVKFYGEPCEPGMQAFGQIALGGGCNEARAAWGFAFLSAVFWILSAVVGGWVIYQAKNKKRAPAGSGD